jgi:hypothetical protein
LPEDLTFEFRMSLCPTIDNGADVCTKDELRSDFAYRAQARPLAELALRHRFMKREGVILYRRQVDWAQYDVFRRNGGHGSEFFHRTAILRILLTAPDAMRTGRKTQDASMI